MQTKCKVAGFRTDCAARFLSFYHDSDSNRMTDDELGLDSMFPVRCLLRNATTSSDACYRSPLGHQLQIQHSPSTNVKRRLVQQMIGLN